jgi:beta-lactamase class A
MQFPQIPCAPLSLLFGLFGLVLTATPATADTLQSWRFDRDRNQLSFSTDEAVRPTVQLVPNPARLVIDLPGIRFDRPKVNQAIGGSIQQLRIARFEKDTTRLVLDLAPTATIDPSRVVVRQDNSLRWTIQLPQIQPAAPANPDPTSSQPIAIAVPLPPPKRYSPLIPAGQNLAWLQQRLNQIRQEYRSLSTGMVFVDVQTGNYVDFNGDRTYPTASIIKLPILIAFFQEIDAGRIRLDETWTMTRDVIVGGSGAMQDRPVNSRFSALEVATNMMTISDNTATNMVIKRMGGLNTVNQRLAGLGLEKTRLRNWLPDLNGTNTTTLKELVQLLALIDQRKVLSARSHQQALQIMRNVQNRKLLAAGVGRGGAIAHKTGYIGFMLGDAGIIELPNGKRYLAAVIVESGHGDPNAWDFVPEVSSVVYSYFNNAMKSPAIGMLHQP